MLRSTESLTVMTIIVKEVALRQKYLQGNHSLRVLMPLMRSANIEMRQRSDAVAM